MIDFNAAFFIARLWADPPRDGRERSSESRWRGWQLFLSIFVGVRPKKNEKNTWGEN